MAGASHGTDELDWQTAYLDPLHWSSLPLEPLQAQVDREIMGWFLVHPSVPPFIRVIEGTWMNQGLQLVKPLPSREIERSHL